MLATLNYMTVLRAVSCSSVGDLWRPPPHPSSCGGGGLLRGWTGCHAVAGSVVPPGQLDWQQPVVRGRVGMGWWRRVSRAALVVGKVLLRRQRDRRVSASRVAAVAFAEEWCPATTSPSTATTSAFTAKYAQPHPDP